MYYNSRHGGDLYQAAALAGVPKDNIVDLSTNTNPLGTPLVVPQFLLKNMNEILNYPDLEYRLLYKGLEDFSSMPSENIIAGNGASEIINLFISVVKPKRILIVHPTYGEYERESSKFKAKIDYYVPEDLCLDFQELKNKFPKYNAVFICNPNNPTGKLIPKISLLELLPLTHDTWLFVDESFMDFVTESESYSLRNIVKNAKLFILHSLTKIYAIPGLRIGCGYGPADLIARMRENQIPWSINNFAVIAAIQAMRDSDFIKASQENIKSLRAYVEKLILPIANIRLVPSDVNFFLLNISQTGYTSSSLQERLLQKGYLVRNCNTFPGMKEDYIRIALRDKDIMTDFVYALREVLEGGDLID